MENNNAICNHSTTNKYIVFSLHQDNKSDIHNAIAHGFAKVTMDRLNINYKELIGSYKGSQELSFIINKKDYDLNHRELVEIIFNKHNQESIMLLEPHKHGLQKATLLYAHSEPKFIGYLREAPEHVALTQDSWSYRPDLDIFWIVTESDTTQNLQQFFNELILKELDKVLDCDIKVDININLK